MRQAFYKRENRTLDNSQRNILNRNFFEIIESSTNGILNTRVHIFKELFYEETRNNSVFFSFFFFFLKRSRFIASDLLFVITLGVPPFVDAAEFSGTAFVCWLPVVFTRIVSSATFTWYKNRLFSVENEGKLRWCDW